MAGCREDQGTGLPQRLDAAMHRLLRRAVLEHASTEPRRLHLPRLHVGTPGGATAVLTDRPDEPLDHALRTDLVAALVRRAGIPDPLVWLARTGDPAEAQDVDVLWLAAARAAYAEAGRHLVYVVVNRHGWRDPRSGTARTWVRLRERTGTAR